MTVFALVLVAGALAAMVVVHAYLLRRAMAFFTDRIREQDALEEGRRVALYKQQKAMSKTVSQSDAAVRKLADRTRHLQDEATLAHQRADALLKEVKQRG